jgi:hypothetical protein
MVIHEDGKKIETGSVKEDYRKSYRIFLLLFLISFNLNLIILFFYLEKETPWRSVLKERKETGGGEQGKSAEGMIPIPIVHVKTQEYFLLCEKNAKTLCLFHSEPNRLGLIKSYPCIVGSSPGEPAERISIFEAFSEGMEKGMGEPQYPEISQLLQPGFREQ